MDILTVIWTALSFLLNIVWSLVWFILRDLISTALWLLIVGWLILGVRYRSFSAGSLAMLRYGRYGLLFFWRWIRRRPPPLPQDVRLPNNKVQLARARRRVPFGYVSVSEQLNMVVVAALALLFLA